MNFVVSDHFKGTAHKITIMCFNRNTQTIHQLTTVLPATFESLSQNNYQANLKLNIT